MSEVLMPREEPNKWDSPEAQALLRLHTAQQMQAGIFKSYLQEGCDQYQGPYPDQKLSQEMVQAELPLSISIEKPAWTDKPNSERLYLAKFNPTTGKELYHGNHENDIAFDTLVGVAVIDVATSEITEQSSHFNESQIRLLHQQSQELDAMGLLGPL